MYPKFIITHVSQEDIDHSIRRDSKRCPLALSLNRQIGGSWHVASVIYDAEETYSPSALTTLYNHSARSFKFMLNFDKGLSVTPSTFRLTKKVS